MPFYLPLLIALIACTPKLTAAKPFLIGKFANSLALAPCDKIIRQVYTRLEMDFQILELPGRRSLKFANEGRVDAELCRIQLTEQKYKNLIRVTPSVFPLDFAALTRTESDLKLRNISDLKGLRIGTARGMLAAELVLMEDKIIYDSSVPLIVKLLNDRLVDVVILPSIELIDAINQAESPNRYRLSPTLYSYPLFHFLHKKHAHLVPRLSEAITAIKSSEK